MTSYGILVISRRQHLVTGLQGALDPDLHTLQWAPSRAQALSVRPKPFLIVLDLPHGGGGRITKWLKAHFNIPILALVPNTADAPPLAADACLPCDAAMHQLTTRIATLLPQDSGALLHAAGLTLNTATRQLEVDGHQHSLSPRLCDLLGVLMRHPGQVVGREQIVREVWRTEYVKNTRMLDAQISRLRKLVEPDPRQPSRVHTVWGKGYLLGRTVKNR